MAIIVDVFCPHCKEIRDTLVENSCTRKISCTQCGSEWDREELKVICLAITSRAETLASIRRHADSVRILLRHMRNPFTGENYA